MDHSTLLGIVHVETSSIEFQTEVEPRQLDPIEVEILADIFRNNCERDKFDNHMRALVGQRELDYILYASHLTKDDLRASLLGEGYPKVDIPNKLYCLRGRRRIAAAGLALQSNDQWWTIQLHDEELVRNSRELILRKEAEQYSHQLKWKDGEIYRKIRYYQSQSNDAEVQKWMRRLSPSKRADLRRLLENRILVGALDRLLVFPGHWNDLNLGYVKRLLASHCYEELACYLHHIFDTFDIITLKIPALRPAVDLQTVRALEQRAPTASTLDRQYIIENMDTKVLFPSISDDNLRRLIKQAILGLRIIIPTFKSFHQNFKFLEIGAKILRHHLLSELNASLYTTLTKPPHWALPENLEIEVQEGKFSRAVLPQGERPERFAYRQQFISALRQFPSLSKDVPKGKREILRETDAPAYSSLFLWRAHVAGFKSDKILKGPVNQPVLPKAQSVEELRHDGHTIKRRMGRPSYTAYKQFRTRLFLPNLLEAYDEVSDKPSVMFVMQDFINAFFGSSFKVQIVSHSSPARALSSQPLSENNFQMSHERISQGTLAEEGTAVAERQGTSQLFVSTNRSSDIHLSSHERTIPPERAVNEMVISPVEISPVSPVNLSSHTDNSCNVEHDYCSNSVVDHIQMDVREQGRSHLDSAHSDISTHNEHSQFSPSTLAVNDCAMSVDSSGSDLFQNGISRDCRSFLIPRYLQSPVSSAESDEASRVSHVAVFPDLPSDSSVGNHASPEFDRDRRSFLVPGDSGVGNHASPEFNRGRGSFLVPGDSEVGNHISPEFYRDRRSFLLPGESGVGNHASPESGQDRRLLLESIHGALLTQPLRTESWSAAASGHFWEDSRDRRSFLELSHSFDFIEYNGMRELRLSYSQASMNRYLEQRRGWVWMLIRQQTVKTLRPDRIMDHMIRNNTMNDSAYVIVKPDHARRIRDKLSSLD